MEILAFIFSGFWIFIGTLFLIGVTLGGIASIVHAATGCAKCGGDNDNTTRN